MTIFAEEKCGYPQKSFVDYGYREEKISAGAGQLSA